MMTNLFSVFDPSTNLMSWSLNWLSSMMFLMFIPSMFWLLPSRFNKMWLNIMIALNKEFKSLLGNSYKKMTLIFISLFSFILFNNFLGLFPYIFTSSSHMVFSLTLSLPLWLSFMLFGWINHSQHMFSHLIPQGTPPVLMPFMVIIETISNVIRPGTLAIRLSANMIAGHLLLTLLGNTGPKASLMILVILLITQMALLILEMAVSFIQSYVFAVLTTLYSSEVY
uniref:ATP synthase subunit a n=1 Tax=Stimulopalpus japonicus TaxID=209965 RepID=A0A343QCJ1_9NEOP|nr:ATP synthase F0 subunit 6 [Stimulopalpus japonicus]ATU07138.1 ATP synthase F0 subunit 6 [Stimulopalpus japonicus]